MSAFETAFEKLIWSSRLVVIVAVIVSLVSAVPLWLSHWATSDTDRAWIMLEQ